MAKIKYNQMNKIAMLKHIMLSARAGRSVALLHDLLAIPIAWLGSYWLRFNLASIPHPVLVTALQTLPVIIVIQEIMYFVFGLYRGIWRFASIPDLIRIIKAVLFASMLTALIVAFISHFQDVPRSIFPLYVILLITILGGGRLSFRWIKHNLINFDAAKRVLIIGASHAGEGLIRDLLRGNSHSCIPVAVIDDDLNKHGREIHGVRVVGGVDQLAAVVDKYNVELIFIAIPVATSLQMRRIVNLCEETNLPFSILPSISDLASGKVSINALRKVSIEDLLGREPVVLDWESISTGLTSKIVLVSGGGGSIGSELCRQIASLQPRTLIVMENNEFNLYLLEQELRHKFPHLHLSCHLVDILDRIAVNHWFAKFKPDVVFHAAAYKHVPILESHLRMAVKNNILGTWILAQASIQHNVKQFTLISSDKAVNPVNILGATKRAAEVICQNCISNSYTRFATVRFGNVLDSAGSVVPLFRKQIADGGPVTVTHEEITRFFMTIPEAAQLILQATVMCEGGEIFVLDMGEPIKIRYLAEQMIQLAGLRVGEDVEICYTGLRPGEKLYEELFHENEQLINTAHKKILQSRHATQDWDMLSKIIADMIAACDAYDEESLLSLLVSLVPEYKPYAMRSNHAIFATL